VERSLVGYKGANGKEGHMASLPKQRRTAKRRRLSFSLRTLLILTTLASIVLGIGGNILLRARRQRALVARIESLSGSVV
jgi:hypothetical protein